MAKRVQVLLVDDTDNSVAADETVSFALDGVSYSIDLSSENAAALRDSLARWIGHAERVGGRRATKSAPKIGRLDLNDVRAWARSHGHDVKDRGRVPANVLAAYDAAH